MKAIVDFKTVKLFQDAEKVKNKVALAFGEIRLFALNYLESTNKYDLIVAADWIEKDDEYEHFSKIQEWAFETISDYPHLISRTVALSSTEPFVQELTFAIGNFEAKSAREVEQISNAQIGQVTLNRCFVFCSAPTVSELVTA